MRLFFPFGGIKVSYGETYIYAETVIENYKKTYGDDIFDTDVETSDGSTAPLADGDKERCDRQYYQS